jgi:hypothetical protein
MILFEWDEAKASRNRRKHGIAFEDSVQVFEDPFAVARADRVEGDERRWQTVGIVGSHCGVNAACARSAHR